MRTYTEGNKMMKIIDMNPKNWKSVRAGVCGGYRKPTTDELIMAISREMKALKRANDELGRLIGRWN